MSDAEPLSRHIYRLLADGSMRSGPSLAAECGVSRDAVWKTVSALRVLGVSVESVAQRGYRLAGATALLEVARIRGNLAPAIAACVRSADCVWRTGSTNADLLQRGAAPPGSFDFLTAEFQSAGRGRRARSWFAPPGGAICLSLSWSFAAPPADLSALSLAVGVCALRALVDFGVSGVTLKWPNDLVADGAKLGGILIELQTGAAVPANVVIGMGLNVALGASVRDRVAASGTRAADLRALGVVQCDRNRLVGVLLSHVVAGLEQFQREGFRAFASEWRAADALAGKSVLVTGGGSSIAGHARGIDSDGALCLQTRDGLHRFVSGDVSVRATA